MLFEKIFDEHNQNKAEELNSGQGTSWEVTLQREIMEGRMEGKRRPRQKLMDSMMEDGYGKLKEESQQWEEWSRWTFGPARRQIT